MGKAWFDASSEAKAVFAEADQVLAGALPGGAKLSELCFSGPADSLNRTDVSQPAIYTASVACWRALAASFGLSSDALAQTVSAGAGLSLGEYSALHLAGVFSFADGLRLVALRGRAMQEAAEAVPSGMVALIGADEAKAQALCDEARGSDVLVCANFNAPGQIVISGSKAACDRAVALAGNHGLRAQALVVAGAFHSPIMQPAAERLGAQLAKTAMAAPAFAIYSNVTAKPHEMGGSSVQSIRELLIRQLTSPVRWAESCAAIASSVTPGTTFHELAPGKTLTGLYKRINRDVAVVNHDQPALAAQP